MCIYYLVMLPKVSIRLRAALAYSKDAYTPSKLDEALAFSSFASMNPKVYPVEQENDLVIKPKKVLGPIATRAQWH